MRPQYFRQRVQNDRRCPRNSVTADDHESTSEKAASEEQIVIKGEKRFVFVVFFSGNNTRHEI
jgi:hypothetical protein